MIACFDLGLRVNGSASGAVSLEPGSSATVSVSVRNISDWRMAAWVRVYYDGVVVVDRKTRALLPGESVSDHVGLGSVGAGSHEVSAVVAPVLEGWDDDGSPAGGGSRAWAEHSVWIDDGAAPDSSHDLEGPEPRAGGADQPVPQPRPLSRGLVDAVLAALREAVSRGVPFRELVEAVVAVAPPSFRWPRQLAWGTSRTQLRIIRNALCAARVDSDADLRAALDRVDERLRVRPRGARG
jgi:hypothetical protein